MIFYFTGTGNSLFVAKNIALTQGETLVSIAQEYGENKSVYEYGFKENEVLGFVFPVYAWGPPTIVLDFISRLKILYGNPFVFSLCTCGDEEGYTTNKLKKLLISRDITLNSAFTLVMPNNYIIGFDVDTKEIEQKKLREANQRLNQINSIIAQRKSGVFQLIPGKAAYIKSSAVNYLFNRFAKSTKGFYANDKCICCRLCESICPVNTIKVQDKPVWGKTCTQCLACIHRCPVRAIEYGNKTVGKGRYVHPSLPS